MPCTTQRLLIATPLDLQIAVTRILNWAALSSASAVDRSLIASMASELGHNILKYAKSGYLELDRIETQSGVEIEVRAIDHGPGIRNLDQAMQEHFSTGGTLGLGLPGVRRMADRFAIASSEHTGTQVIAAKRIHGGPAPNSPMPASSHTTAPAPLAAAAARPPAPTAFVPAQFDFGARCRPYPGEELCGDQAAIVTMPNGFLLAMIDGSGHGPKAHQVASMLATAVHEQAQDRLPALMQELHYLAQGTRGAAVGLAYVDASRQTLRSLAVGNTGLLALGHKTWHGVARDGLVGERMPSLHEQTTTFAPGDKLLMFSDGLSSSSMQTAVGQLPRLDAADIAARLVDRLGKTYDDASCIALQWQP